MVLKSSRHNVSTGNTVRSKWANNKHDFHPVIRKSVLGDGTSEGDMFDISDGYIRCCDGYFLDDGCLETGPSTQATLLYSLNKRGRWKIPTLLARGPTHPMDRPMETGNENMITKAHHFLAKQASCYQCFSVRPGGSSGGRKMDLEKERRGSLKAARSRNVTLSRRKDHKKRVPAEVEEEDPMALPLDKKGQQPEVHYDVCLTCPPSVVQTDQEEDRPSRQLQTTSRKLKYSHTNVLSQFQEYMDAEEDMMEDIFDWAIYDSLNEFQSPNYPELLNSPPQPSQVKDEVNLNDFVDASDLQIGDPDSDLHEVVEGDFQADSEPEPIRRGVLLGDWVTPARKGGNGKRNKHRKSSMEDEWEFVDKEDVCSPQDWEVVPDQGN